MPISRRVKDSKATQPSGCAQNVLTAVGVIIVLVVGSVALNECDGRPRARGPFLMTGGYARFKQASHAAPTQADYDRLVQLISAKDTEGVAVMVLAGKAMIVREGTRCRLIDPGLLTSEVRILEGPHSLQSCFVAAESLEAE